MILHALLLSRFFPNSILQVVVFSHFTWMMDHGSKKWSGPNWPKWIEWTELDWNAMLIWLNRNIAIINSKF